jgi:hypothetical protein
LETNLFLLFKSRPRKAKSCTEINSGVQREISETTHIVKKALLSKF